MKITLAIAKRIVWAHFGPSYECVEIKRSRIWARCRIVKDSYHFCRVRSETVYDGPDWDHVLQKAIPYYGKEYTPTAATALSDYCGRLYARRKAREDKQRRSDNDAQRGDESSGTKADSTTQGTWHVGD